MFTLPLNNSVFFISNLSIFILRINSNNAFNKLLLLGFKKYFFKCAGHFYMYKMPPYFPSFRYDKNTFKISSHMFYSLFLVKTPLKKEKN